MPEQNFARILNGEVDARLDQLYEAGCDDATFGSIDGVHYADFDREAPSLVEAIASAICAVESVPGLGVTRVEPDGLLTMTEMAESL